MNKLKNDGVIDLLLQGETFFIYNPKDEIIRKVVHGDKVVLEYKTIEDVFLQDSHYVIYEEGIKDIKKFLKDSRKDNKRVCFKMKSKILEEEWFFIETIRHSSSKGYIYCVLKNLDDVLKQRDELVKMSEIDNLTGLLNKETIEKYFNQIKLETNNTVLLALLDIDYFKNINDVYGHIFGDVVIKEVANKLLNFIGDDGECARFGGDEFIIIKKYDHIVCEAEVREFARSLKRLFEELKFENINDFYCTQTSGIVSYPNDGTSFKDLFQKMDKALYRGKKKGRDCYIIYNHNLHSNINTLDILENHIEKSLSLNSISWFLENILKMVLSSRDVLSTMNNVIEQIGEFFKLERVILGRRDTENYEIIKQWYQKDEYKVKGFNNLVSYKEYRNLFIDGEILIISDFYSPRIMNKTKIQQLVDSDFQTMSLVQLGSFNNNLDFIISYEMCSIKRLWQRQEIEYFRIISKIIFSVLINSIEN